MKCTLGLVATLLIVVSTIVAADLPQEAAAKNYNLELAGLGFAYDDSIPDSLEAKPMTFLFRVVSDLGTRQRVGDALPEESVMRLEYVSYPLEVVELSQNFFEANVYSRKITEHEDLVVGERVGKIKLTLTDYTGLYGAKGQLTIGKKSYTVFLYRKEALDGFYRWINEIE